MKLKIQNIPFIPLYESYLLPMLKPLAVLRGEKGGYEAGRMIEFIGSARRATIVFFLLAVVMAFLPFFSMLFLHNPASLQKANILLLFFSAVSLIFSLVSFVCWRIERKRLAVFANALNKIIEVCRNLNQRNILLMDSINEVEKTIEETLVRIARGGLLAGEIEPQGETQKKNDLEFRLLHRNAEAIGLDLGPFKPFYDKARTEIKEFRKLEKLAKEKMADEAIKST